MGVEGIGMAEEFILPVELYFSCSTKICPEGHLSEVLQP